MAAAQRVSTYFGKHSDKGLEAAERALSLDSNLAEAPENMNMCYNIGCTLITDLSDHDAALDMLGPYFARVSPEALDWAKHDRPLTLAERFAAAIPRPRGRRR
jgi:hypothetical protein